MNEERIKAFADHADRYAYSISDADPSVNWYKVRDEKFAELIATYCARICYDEDFVSGSGYAREITKRFGITE